MHACPSCERPFEGVRDFPVVLISTVKRIEVPDILMGHPASDTFYDNDKGGRKQIPPEVKALFRRQVKKVRHDGLVYIKNKELRWRDPQTYSTYYDVTDAVHEAVQHPQVTSSLAALEARVNQDTDVRSLYQLSGFTPFKAGSYEDWVLDLGKYGSLLKPDREQGQRVCRVSLLAGRSGGSWISYEISQPVAEFLYTGKLRH